MRTTFTTRISPPSSGFYALKTSRLIAMIFLLAWAPMMIAQPPQQDDGAFAMGGQGRMVRGTVTAVVSDHLTVKTDAGDTFQIAVTANTRIIKDRQPIKFADIHVGDGAGAMGVIDQSSKTIHAAALILMDAAQVKKLRDDLGKTYITGKVTAIDELELTIHRQDGVSQKIAVDDGTSFKRGSRRAGMAMRGDGSGSGFDPGVQGGSAPDGAPSTSGESITLADVKIGDMIAGPGALKNGVFVPTQLTVIDAAAMAHRKRQNGANGALDQASPGAEQH